MDQVTRMQKSEMFEQMRERFPELDEPARRRAAARIAAGTEAQAAFAAESVMLHMVRVYN